MKISIRISGTMEYKYLEESNVYKLHIGDKIIEISEKQGEFEIRTIEGKMNISPGYSNVIYIDCK